MFYFRINYKRNNDSSEYELNCISDNEITVINYLESLYGRLHYWNSIEKKPIHLITNNIKEWIYLDLQKVENETK